MEVAVRGGKWLGIERDAQRALFACCVLGLRSSPCFAMLGFSGRLSFIGSRVFSSGTLRCNDPQKHVGCGFTLSTSEFPRRSSIQASWSQDTSFND